jgi:hypothetical protein
MPRGAAVLHLSRARREVNYIVVRYDSNFEVGELADALSFVQ